MKPLSVYIHIPFCRRKCAYCDFTSYAGRDIDIPRYFSALNNEISGYELNDRRVISVYFGGGTPSCVPYAYLCDALEGMAHSITDDCEISIEANPGTLTSEALTAYRRAGVNRLSLGVQAFDDGLLRSLGRIHTSSEAITAYYMAREAGFDNISLDLMYALPGQTMDMWRETLDVAASLTPEHVSAYALIVEPNTPMSRRVMSGEAILPGDDEVNDMQRLATRVLQDNGLSRYEISNYAAPGRECRHNTAYWRRGEYLGVGCAAHSFMNGARFNNSSDIMEYMISPKPVTRCDISEAEGFEEYIMLGTRTREGVELSGVKNADVLERAGLIRIANAKLTLTERGMEMHNSVVMALLGYWGRFVIKV